jgi:ribose transport system ATP-binding protein
MEHIEKRFPGVHALNDVRFLLKSGSVHGLVGENGAGKSTLMKVLTGIYKRDSGSVEIKGRAVNYASPRDALNDGVVMIHQELNLMPHLSVADNIFIGKEPRKGFILDDAKKNMMTKELLESLHLDIDPRMRISRLSVAMQQMVEIAKAFSYSAEVMIMDEPTAALTTAEVRELFAFIRNMKARGLGIIYISHRLEELWEITDEVTVMRDGQFVGSLATADADMGRIIGMMVGRVIYEEPKLNSMAPPDAPEVLRVENLSSPDVRDVSFSLKKGEILGFAGLMGAGRTEAMRLIFGATPKTGGRIFLRGREVEIKSPKDAVTNGIGYLSEDRKVLGLATGLSVSNNITMADLAKFSSGGIVNERGIVAESLRYVKKMNIRTPSVDQLVGNLSGGNQQKVVVAKWLLKDCEILIIDEPTRGIDVGAKSEIYKLMNQLVEEGKSIIMISSELPELLRMSDRIAVMCEGAKTGELDISEATQEKIMQLATAREAAVANGA